MLAEFYEIEEVVRFAMDFSNVALQMPDCMLQDARAVVKLIVERLQAQVSIMYAYSFLATLRMGSAASTKLPHRTLERLRRTLWSIVSPANPFSASVLLFWQAVGLMSKLVLGQCHPLPRV